MNTTHGRDLPTPESRVMRLTGELRLADARKLWQDLKQFSEGQAGSAVFDLTDVSMVDGVTIALLVETRRQLLARGVRAEISGARPAVAEILSIYSDREDATVSPTPTPPNVLTRIGKSFAEWLSELKVFLGFLGEFLSTIPALVRKPRSANWRDFLSLCEKTGANALPIVLLINFLVGFVMAFQSAKQLRMYGANLYVADLIGISMTRELAPLMTAIIVCGRSGAAFAAEIGTMKVNEEIDALRTLGLMPFSWLVVPRVAALILVVPLLTLIADFVGIAGGMFVAVTDLELTPRGYFNETLLAVVGWDVLTGFLKSIAFALAIALIACQQGMAVSLGAESVGRRTTTSVVITLFVLVALDALFTVVFRILDV